MHILNITAYKFISLDALMQRREELLKYSLELHLKGTILLSAEGINLSVAGTRKAIESFTTHLCAHPEFTDLQFKETLSREQPFNRMLVKIKKEIIGLGLADIQPAVQRAPAITPHQLKKWLDQGFDDQGKEIILLDARNHYEIRLGKFKGALDLHIHHFRQFTQAIQDLDEQLKEKTMVTYCTGGIRCEKAGLLLKQKGYDAYQLEGGILNYFKECQDAHYEGDCFIYDRRVALDCALQETDTVQCFACLQPVLAEEQNLSTYVPGQSCPACA